MAMRVYEYGLLPPTVNAELVDQQIGRAHRYRNMLVEIERDRRTAVRAALATHPDLHEVQEALTVAVAARDRARQDIKDIRAKSRSRSEPTEARARARELQDEVRQLAAKHKEAKRALLADEVVQQQLAAIDEESRARIKLERARCGVYWGTYLLQEAAADQARKERGMPVFRRYDGEGRVSVQIQGGMADEDLLQWGGSGTLIRISPCSSDAWDPGVRRGDRRRAQRTTLMMRVDSTDRGRPIWAEWPMVMHRPLPKGSTIKVATVQRRRRNCLLWAWTLQLTVAVPDDAPNRPVPADGAVALNLGYCVRPDGGIRAGYLVGSDGEEMEILVAKSDFYRGGAGAVDPSHRTRIKDGLGKADSIRGFRDRNMDEVRARMLEWRAAFVEQFERGLQGGTEDVGEPSRAAWLVGRTQSIHAWRSADRFRRLSLSWAAMRAHGDDDGFALLDAWRLRDEHLECYESGLRTGALRDRREGYRIIAAKMAQRYRTLLIEDTDLRDFQEGPPPESDTPSISPVKRNMNIAAGSELRTVLRNAFGESRVTILSAADKTRTCYDCGSINEIDRNSGSRMHTCACGASWDQDANFCRNLLRSHEQSAPAEPVVVATGGKWKKRREAAADLAKERAAV